MSAKLQMDTSTGTSDLAWNLVMLFFITTFIALRPASGLVGDVAAEDGPAEGTPVVVAWPADAVDRLAAEPVDLALLEVVEPGSLSRPAAGERAEAWLQAACVVEAPPTVLVRCPGDATHTQCQRLLKALLRQGPCHFRY